MLGGRKYTPIHCLRLLCTCNHAVTRVVSSGHVTVQLNVLTKVRAATALGHHCMQALVVVLCPPGQPVPAPTRCSILPAPCPAGHGHIWV